MTKVSTIKTTPTCSLIYTDSKVCSLTLYYSSNRSSFRCGFSNAVLTPDRYGDNVKARQVYVTSNLGGLEITLTILQNNASLTIYDKMQKFMMELSRMKMKTFSMFNHTIFLLNLYMKCIVALINLLIFIAKKECIKLHHKAFLADDILRSTKIRALATRCFTPNFPARQS